MPKGRVRKLLLAGATSLLLLTTPLTRPARAADLGDILEILERMIELIDTLPEDPTGGILTQLRDLVGQAQRSYLELSKLERALQDLYPEAVFATVDAIMEHIKRRQEDREDRVREAMRLAAQVMEQRALVDARILALTALNRSPVGILAGIQLNTEATLQVASSLETLTRLTAELGQLEADQRLMEDWQRQKAAEWSREHYPGGYWTGPRTWQPDIMQRNF